MSTPANPAAVAGAPKSPPFQAAFQVGFKTTHVDPPSSVYIAPDDFLVISVWANFTPSNIRLTGRLLRAPLPNWNQVIKTPGQPDAPTLLPPEVISFDDTFVNTNAVRLLNFFTMPLAEGFLLSLGVTTNAVVGSGQYCYVSVSIGRPGAGATALPKSLFAGYTGVNVNTGWPDSQPQRPTDGAGTIRTITGSTPAAGAEINEVVPTSARWSLLSLRATLTTSVTVQNRQGGLVLDDGANIFFEIHNNQAQAASLTKGWDFAPGLAIFADGAGEFLTPLPTVTLLRSGWRIRTNTFQLQAGDQWSAPQYTVVEWQDFV